MTSTKEELALWLAKETGLESAVIEIPPNPSLGDFAFPCFALSKIHKKNPAQIASELATTLALPPSIERVEAKGAYLNFFVRKSTFAKKLIEEISALNDRYGAPPAHDTRMKERVMIEYSSPNTNKPMHLGHVRNNILGDTTARILTFCGDTVIKANLINDRGVHICKAMLAYQKWGGSKTPRTEGKKGDHFVGDYYVLFAQKAKEKPSLEEEAQEMLRKWEAGDKKTVALWRKMNRWVIKGFEQTYKEMNITFDRTYRESEIYLCGKDMILKSLEAGKLERDENNNIVVDLSAAGLGKKVLLRGDGTSIYITQDLYLAKKKFEDYTIDRSIYVVGSEQEHHFRVLFAALDALGYDYGKKSFHYSYGMVNLPEGKMKSREGTVVDADDLMRDTIALARDEITKRADNISARELASRSKSIGLGAIRFFILKNEPSRTIIYNPQEAISFEGETGPYVQYAHARICSILRKTPATAKRGPITYELLAQEEEKQILLTLARFPSVIEEARAHLRPSTIAHYLLSLSQEFNNFYHKHPVITQDRALTRARVALIEAIRTILSNGLFLLGIDALQKM